MRSETSAILLAGLLATLLSLPVNSQEYTGAGLAAELCANLRSTAMGGVGAALPPTTSNVPNNLAGIGFLLGKSVYSSGFSRLRVYDAGQVCVYAPHLGMELDYLSVGDVPLTDEFGNIDGSFAFRAFSITGALGGKWSAIPGLTRVRSLDMVSTSLSVTVLREAYGSMGTGIGGRLNLDTLIWSKGPPGIMGFLFEECSIGIRVSNLISWPMTYESGQGEDWSRSIEAGIALWPTEDLVIATQVGSGTDTRSSIGVEWTIDEGIALRVGLCADLVLSVSGGVGLKLRSSVVDMAIIWHPVLPLELRAAFTIVWP